MRRLAYVMFLAGVLCFAFAIRTGFQENASRHESSPLYDSDADARPIVAWERAICGLVGGGVMILTGFYLHGRQSKAA